jgi:hypothetical protein
MDGPWWLFAVRSVDLDAKLMSGREDHGGRYWGVLDVSYLTNAANGERHSIHGQEVLEETEAK